MASRHAVLWSEGLEHWNAGRLEEAVVAIRKAIIVAGDASVPEYPQSLGCILSKLDRWAEAHDAFVDALRVACAHAGPDAPSVTTARYFLAETLLFEGQPDEALAVIEPSLGVGAQAEPLLRCVRALALYDLERDEEAAEEARAAIEGASSNTQREEFVALLAHITDPEE